MARTNSVERILKEARKASALVGKCVPDLLEANKKLADKRVSAAVKSMNEAAYRLHVAGKNLEAVVHSKMEV